MQQPTEPTEPAKPDAAFEAELLRLMGRGEKLKAVKLYRDQTGLSLMESKQAVETEAARHGIALPDPGCGGVLFVLVVAVVAIIALLAGVLMLRS